MSKDMLVDDRVGSKDLYPALKKHGARMVRLESADVMFTGRGPEDVPVAVGVERKRITDLIDSMETGRLVDHQIPLMLDNHEFNYVLIEGLWRSQPKTGELEYLSAGKWKTMHFRKRKFLAKSVHNFLNTLSLRTGVFLVSTPSKAETIQWLLAVYDWWNVKAWDQHRSHLKILDRTGLCFSGRPSVVRRMANCLPGIGDDKAIKVAQKFRTPYEMATASIEDWTTIDGIGETIAEKATKALWGTNGKKTRD